MLIINCAKCVCCTDPDPKKIDSLSDPKVGLCRRHSPTNIVFMPDGKTLTLWPVVKMYYDGCVEGEIGLSTLLPGNGRK